MTEELFPTVLECTTCQLPVLIHLPASVIDDGGDIILTIDYGQGSYYRHAVRAHPCWTAVYE